MDFVEYMSELETIGEILDQRCQTMDPMEYAATHGVDNALLHRMQELIPIARQVMTNDELRWGKMNYLRIQEIRECSLPDEEKILLGTIHYAASVIGDEKRFRKYFERYRADQPIFEDKSLWEKVRDGGELISMKDCHLVNDHLQYGNTYYKLPYFSEAMVEYVKSRKGNDAFIRVDPYVVLRKRPLKTVMEAVIHPIDPTWIRNLGLYPRAATGGVYVLQEPVRPAPGCKPTPAEQVAYDEYLLRKIRRLEVSAERSNKGNLHMMIEELREEVHHGRFYVCKCIHLDTDDAMGTDYRDAMLNHIDLAINVYDSDAYHKRSQESLAGGMVVDATFRTHILRMEKVPFTDLFQLAVDFLDSKTLYSEWVKDLFGKTYDWNKGTE